MMLSAFIVLLLALCIDATLSPEETAFICHYNGVTGFPVPCVDAQNACAYKGIRCANQTGATWNETIISLSLVMTLPLDTTNAIPTQIGYLTSLQRLRLQVGAIGVESTMPREIGLCTSLTSIDIFMTLGGTIPNELFLGTSRLTYLQLIGGIAGTIPDSLSSLTGLTYINLYLNHFSGTFPSIARLTLLKTLNLGLNDFTGTLPDASLLGQLASYRVDGNSFHGNVPLFNSSKLAHVDISLNLLNGTLSPVIFSPESNGSLFFTANVNELVGTIPTELFGPSLVTLDLSYNKLSGTVPSEMIQSRSLEQLVLSHNMLSGTLSSAWNNVVMPSLFKLSFNHNNLTGILPALRMGGVATKSVYTLASHIYMHMNDNEFSGILPSFADFRVPASLDFSNNKFTLDTQSLGSGRNISWLSLTHNPLGELPPGLFDDLSHLTELRSLDLSYCQLSGTLPSLLHTQQIELNNNYFTGTIPASFIVMQNAAFLPVFVDVRLNRLDPDTARNAYIGSTIQTIFSDVVLTDFPQDIDECALQSSECEYLCVDGWFPIPGYTCACPPGFELDPVGKRNCTAVCGDGLLRYPEEQCDYEYSLLGCFHNCTTKPGYKCDATGCHAICGDGLIFPPEECDNSDVGCSATCKTIEGYTCSLESNTCQPCTQSWQPFVYPPNLALFPKLRAIIGDLSVFDFTACVSCTDGYALETRAILAANQCLNMSTQRSLPCSFACSNLTVFNSASESIFTLRNELMRGDFLAILFRSLFNVNITLNTTVDDVKKREVTDRVASVAFNLSPCNVDTTGMMSILDALSQDIVPNLPVRVVRPSACGFQLSATDVGQQIYLSTAIIISVAGALLIIGALCTVYYYYRQSELHSLPEDISWSFIDQWTHPWRWEYHGSSKSGYYSRTYKPDSKEYRRVDSLLTTHFKKSALRVSEITAIYNRALSVSFVNQWKLVTTRRIEAPEQFFHCSFSKDPTKLNIMKYYQDNLLQSTPYNQELVVPLLPVLHGTDYLIAEKIAQTGFASLSSLDPGYFGKGIYFTTSMPYTLPYSCGKRRPAVIISYVNMGNIFPVTEHHNTKGSLKGQALKSGYNSHLVLTGRDGFIYDQLNSNDIICDEIVVSQESQILPAFIIELDIETCQSEYDKWMREIPLPMNNAALLHNAESTEPPSNAAKEEMPHSFVSMDGMLSLTSKYTLFLSYKTNFFDRYFLWVDS